MKWTEEFPTKPGWYYFINKRCTYRGYTIYLLTSEGDWSHGGMSLTNPERLLDGIWCRIPDPPKLDKTKFKNLDRRFA